MPAGREGQVMPTIKGVDVLVRHYLNRPCYPLRPNKGRFVQGSGYARGCRWLFPAGSFCDSATPACPDSFTVTSARRDLHTTMVRLGWSLRLHSPSRRRPHSSSPLSASCCHVNLPIAAFRRRSQNIVGGLALEQLPGQADQRRGDGRSTGQRQGPQGNPDPAISVTDRTSLIADAGFQVFPTHAFVKPATEPGYPLRYNVAGCCARRVSRQGCPSLEAFHPASAPGKPGLDAATLSIPSFLGSVVASVITPAAPRGI